MSLDVEIIDRHPSAVRGYLQVAGPAMALLDAELNFLAVNERFRRMAGWGADLVGGRLTDVMTFMGGGAPPLPGPGRGWNVTLVFKGMDGATNARSFYLANDHGTYALFASHVSNADETYVREVSRLNAELTDLNRVLQRQKTALERANARIAEMARNDALTGLPNRRFFQEALSAQMAATRRHGGPLSVIIADIDHFKSVNDTFGHDAGDQALKMFAELIGSTKREEDMAARWGGEEFVVLTPQTDGPSARLLAERLRRALEQARSLAVPRKLTASFGVTEFITGDDDTSFLARADTALYEAKNSGRNRTVLAEKPV